MCNQLAKSGQTNGTTNWNSVNPPRHIEPEWQIITQTITLDEVCAQWLDVQWVDYDNVTMNENIVRNLKGTKVFKFKRNHQPNRPFIY